MVWLAVDWRTATRTEALRQARQLAYEAHLDGDGAAGAKAAATLAAHGERALAAWLTAAGSGPQDPFVDRLRAGEAALPRDPKAAVAHFSAALEIAPDSPIAIGWRAIAAAKAGQAAVAERELLSAIRLLPGSVRLRVELGRLLRLQKRGAEAVAALQQATALPRADGAAFHELAKAHTTAREYLDGLAAIERALAVAPAGERLGMLRTKAALLNGIKQHEAALPLFREILDAEPGPGAWMNYGAVLDSLHRFEEAAAAYREALALDPRHATALGNLVYLHTGSDPQCAECQAYFAAHPALLDGDLAARYAIALLDARDGLLGLEDAARYLRRTGSGDAFVAALDARLRRDLPAQSLGLLLRARKILRPD